MVCGWPVLVDVVAPPALQAQLATCRRESVIFDLHDGVSVSPAAATAIARVGRNLARVPGVCGSPDVRRRFSPVWPGAAQVPGSAEGLEVFGAPALAVAAAHGDGAEADRGPGDAGSGQPKAGPPSGDSPRRRLLALRRVMLSWQLFDQSL